MNPHKETGEYQEAVALANRVLDRINTDPDDDLAILSRQFIRSTERLAQALKDAREEAYQAGIRRALEITERVQSDPPSTSFEATEAFIGACDEIEFALDAELHGNK